MAEMSSIGLGVITVLYSSNRPASCNSKRGALVALTHRRPDFYVRTVDCCGLLRHERLRRDRVRRPGLRYCIPPSKRSLRCSKSPRSVTRAEPPTRDSTLGLQRKCVGLSKSGSARTAYLCMGRGRGFPRSGHERHSARLCGLPFGGRAADRGLHSCMRCAWVYSETAAPRTQRQRSSPTTSSF